ncbi:MAG: DUF1565 domain-containing protein [Candidatus Thermoplasmatota archaeon]|nr:DUF1565 domain-containing protein [Candidatus Thermoplasmatota archaeon]
MDRARLTTIFLAVLFAMGPISASTPDQSGQSSGEVSPSPLNCSSSTPHDDQTNYYVDGSSGDDTYPGTQACPTKTIQQAVTNAGSDDTITVASGTYMEAVSIDSEGQTLRAATGARVILDGSESVTGDLDATWTQHTELDSGWVWKVDLPKDAWQLFLSYEEEMPARWPNANFSDFSALDDENYWAHGTISGTDIDNSDDDGDGYPDVGCPSGEELHLEGNDWHCVEYLNGELEDDPSCCSSHTGLVDSGIDPVGSIAVLNIGSFRTWSREVLTFDSTEGSFTYAQVPSSGWKFKHHMYFLTQKLELLDTNGEWFFDDDSEERTLYYMPRGDDDPNELDIRVKTKPYGVICDHYDNVKVEGIDFFAAAFKLDDCDESEIRNSTLLYPSTSKRSLGIAGEDQENRYVSRVDDCMGCLIDTCEFLYTDGAAFEAHGGTGSSVGNQINNSYFYYIDWSGSDQISLMTTIAMSGSTNLFTNNTMHKTGTSATIRIGNSPQVMFNEIYDTAHLQSDGTIIQMMQGEQQGAEIAYNWVHDSPKYGIRMDGPFGGTNSGNNASVHHNVVWNINGGIISKGDYHNVSHNTAFDSPVDSSGRNDIVVLYDDTGGNENSVVQYNAADRIAGHRTNTLQVSPFPQNSNISDNWNGYDSDNSGETIASQLADFTAFDFRPVVGSEIDLMLAGAYLSSQTATAPSDPGNYDPSTYYWNPGIKRDPLSPWSRSTYTLPCTGGSYFDGTSCQDSSLGHYVDGWGQTSQVSCAAGTYQPSTAQTACLDADAGHYVDSIGSTSQTECIPGSFQNQTGQTTCVMAPPGTFTSTFASSIPQPCNLGTYQGQQGQTSCEISDPGYFVDIMGSDSQTPCPAGTFNPSSGSISQNTCIDSNPGHYSPIEGTSIEIACDPGSWQNESGQTSCKQAIPGYHVPGASATSQIPCSLGTYQPNVGGINCLTSDPGYFVDVLASAAQFECDLGTFQSQQGSVECDDAQIGFYVNQTASIAQYSCPEGNSTTTVGSTSILDCYIDTDQDGTPDLTDVDDDGDGYSDLVDEFPLDPTEWLDTDGDGLGDNSDPDDDNDSWTDIEEMITCGDSNSLLSNSTPLDTDGDQICDPLDSDDDNDLTNDMSDAFPLDPCASSDIDSDGMPDSINGPCLTGLALDPDIDGDGVENDVDWRPFDPSEWRDTDSDGIGDNSDSDDDGDGVPDDLDLYPLDPTEQSDFDGDGLGNNQDDDDDNDGYFDLQDAFPYDPSASVDTDGDGMPDEIHAGWASNLTPDLDDDGDGYSDTIDVFPLDPAEWADKDEDGIGDNADFDVDGDGWNNLVEIECGHDPVDQASTPSDDDQDGICNELDNSTPLSDLMGSVPGGQTTVVVFLSVCSTLFIVFILRRRSSDSELESPGIEYESEWDDK